jgi:hypothetical protein
LKLERIEMRKTELLEFTQPEIAQVVSLTIHLELWPTLRYPVNVTFLNIMYTRLSSYVDCYLQNN